jgi:hypothetical protein
MAYLGNTVQNQGFIPAIDTFSGNGSTTAFTLSRPVASVAQVEAVINNVVQDPNTAYTVSNNTITFTSAPSSGTNNIYVRYTSLITQVIQPSQGTVGNTQFANNISSIPFAVGGPLGGGNASIMKNRIINGAMVIDQRNAGASVTTTAIAAAGYTVDRWAYFVSAASKFTVQQNAGSVTPPAGFTNYLGATSSSAYSITSGDYFGLEQLIEGYNMADLGWGTANAKTVTLSFWAYSSLTGTFAGSIRNPSSYNRSYVFSYSIPVANTWTQISVTITGDTAGTWTGASNSAGINLYFSIGVGSTYSSTAGSWQSGNYVSATGATSVVGTNGATFYITGVQLEVGSSATGYEYRMYGQELTLCQRYYQVMQIAGQNAGVGVFRGSSSAGATELAVNITGAPMRTNPTVTTVSGGTSLTISSLGGSTSSFTITYSTAVNSNVTGQVIRLRGGGSLTNDAPYIGWNPNADIIAGLSAEL